MPPLAFTESTQACSPAKCSGWAEGPEKLPIVPMTRSDPDAATAEPELELELDALELALLPALLLLLLLLQAVARAATATLSADTRSRAVLRAVFMAGSNPQRSGGMVTGLPNAGRSGELAWRASHGR